MPKIRVGILRGGVSPEYDDSLETGKTVIKHLPDTYTPVDMLVARDGTWHILGMPGTPTRIRNNVDVIFNALHGYYGEDGKAQQHLEEIGVPYTGSGVLGGSLSSNPHLLRKHLSQHGVRMPKYVVITKGDDIEEAAFSVFNTFCPPWCIRYVHHGHRSAARNITHFPDLVSRIKRALSLAETVLIEEGIRGDDVRTFVIEGEHGGTYAIPIGAAYASDEVTRLAQDAHKALGLRHYSHAHLVVSPKRGVYLTDMRTHPALSPDSASSRALAQRDISFSDFLDHVLTLAVKKR